MNPIAWPIGLALPACGVHRAEGLPTAPVTDVAAIARPSSPTPALAAPAGFSLVPDIVTPPYGLPADNLFALIQDVASTGPDINLAVLYADRLRMQYLACDLTFNCTHHVMVREHAGGVDTSELTLWSRRITGEPDLGVKRKLITAC